MCYQNQRYADRFIDAVRSVEAEESAALGRQSTELAAVVAQNLYKLMAYKDEYEVARLALDPEFESFVRSSFGDRSQRRIMLHPPALRAMGLKKKLALGTWANPAMWALRHLKVLRGTPFDVFGIGEVRRTERALPDEYLRLVRRALVTLDDETLPVAVALAGLPDMVRGYESIKMKNVDRFRARASEMIDQLENRPAQLAG